MKIRFLYFLGCPNVEPAKNLLEKILNEENVKAEIQMLEITDLKMAETEHFLGSPTIQINGKDIEEEKESHPALLGCRVYNTKEGLSGIPPLDLIQKAIRASKNQE